jgi:preprotein translocase subunit SecA
MVTANEYLAKRDAFSMGKIYEFLGLSVSYIYNHMDDESRKKSYNCDITYGTSSEFGFDYLRDNGKASLEEMCQSKFDYAVVDEIDNILIDEARTPLIISGYAEVIVDGNEVSPIDCLKIINEIVKVLPKELYEVDEKDHSVSLTDDGISHIENELRVRSMLPHNESLYELKNKNLQHYIYQSLKAWYLFKKNTEYVVENGEIVIVDEFTGRKMKGRRYSDGLHQAIEAKEGVKINKESQTMATITLQNYFKLYKKLAGMTGTAMTEQAEFKEIYGLEIVAIPTHKKMIRQDLDDEIYRTFAEKVDAICKLVLECRAKTTACTFRNC